VASWGLLFDRRGHLQDEFDAVFKRSWGINSVGECKFTLPVNDAKNTEANFQFGNPLLVLNNDGLPPWVGRLDTPRGWGAKTNKHSALSYESIFSDRVGTYGKPYGVINPAGLLFRKIIQVANEEDDTLIRLGDIYDGGGKSGMNISPATLLSDNIAKVLKQSGHEYDVTPVMVENRLKLYGNWYIRQGIETGGSLNDGNCRIDENSLNETGPIKNWLIGMGNNEDTLTHYVAKDELSKYRYGLRAAPLDVDSGALEGIKACTEYELRMLKKPRRTTASNVNDTYPLLRKGNVLKFESAEAGYGVKGIIGTQADVRIIGMAYSDDVDGVALTIMEDIWTMG
jgi:hypothetical protein